LTELTAEDIEALQPTFLGPTWATDDSGWVLPERNRTLGWHIAGWCYEYLQNPDGGPWIFTPEQFRFLLWWYAFDDNGDFIYRRGVLQRLKGWGKDPLLAVICLVEMVGPSRVFFEPLVTHRNVPAEDADGFAIGTPNLNAWVQVAAVSRDQTRNTMSLMPALMSKHFMKTYGIKPGIERIRANGGRQVLEAVTSSPRSLEGNRATFIVLNETHHWIQGNKGHEMYATIWGNATKMDGRYLAITNAFLPGEDSVAERMRDAYEKIMEGKAVDTGFLYDSVEAHSATPLTPEALRIVLPKIRGDATWLKVETIIAAVMDTSVPPARSRRMWLNQIVAEEDAVVSPGEWDLLKDEDAVLRPGDAIVLGFDGAKSDDSTALVAIRIEDRCAFVLALEEKPEGPRGEGWEVNKPKVDAAVRNAFSTYDVKAFYADVAYWESHIDNWAEDYREGLAIKASERNAVAWDMRQALKKVTYAHERLLQAIIDGTIKHDGDLRLKRHAMNARRRENVHGVSFSKESPESPKKVDAYAALMLAHEALTDYRTRGKKEKPRTNRGYFF
jgi:phage terminase large subunit-like protein